MDKVIFAVIADIDGNEASWPMKSKKEKEERKHR